MGADSDAEINRLIAGLNEPSMRAKATHQLAAFGVEAVPRLIAAAEGTWTNRWGVACTHDGQIRRGAILALRFLGPAAAEAVPTLTGLLSHPDPVLRGEAALALGDIGPAAHSAIPALEALARGPDLSVGIEAREALRRLAVR
jgi:HEAT repeat protein